MNISLTPELNSWLKGKIESGLYNTASEVVREALRLLMAREEQKEAMRRELKDELQIGLNQLGQNQGKPFNSALLAEIKASGGSSE